LDHLETGRLGESLAERYFRGKGWTIIGRNVRVRFGELDLVALDGGELVIVEVRTRSIGKLLPAEETVGPRKLKVLVRSGRIYVEKCRWTGPWRIDLLGINLDPAGSPELVHLPDITVGRIDA
jgi:putative endonuclease